MTGKKPKPYAILVFGVPMSGKTQFAVKFSRRFKAPLLNFEAIPGISGKAFLSITTQIADCKQNIVIDDRIDTFKQREELRKVLSEANYNIVLIWIQIDINTVKTRLKNHLKSVQRARSYFEARLDQLEAPEENENAIVISGKHTFESQLRSVLSRLSRL